ncbi:uncharacterized protein CEXT_553251 [Caerostris extrusa]|uniref:Uncharacterized protein n=1 Tax=Caerostris extrusa TaxID=172846 RepID=A0AAV4TRF5_CAEEX|nr:uncharacterized protein CEXT_553251 [Caerostris extrusa]
MKNSVKCRQLRISCQGSCPPPEYLKPCVCRNDVTPVTVSCAGLTGHEALERVFRKSRDYPIHSLILERSTMMYIPASIFTANHQVIFIKIVNCTMASVFDETPPVKSDDIGLFTIHDSTFQRGLDWELFRNFTWDEIIIENTEVKRIGPAFNNYMNPDTRGIIMNNTKTHSLSDKAFSKMTDLDRFICTKGSITTLKRTMFPSPTKLYLLDLSEQNIATLPDNMFTNMPSLETVNFDKNQFQHLPSTVWKDVWKTIVEVGIDDNPLVCDCKIKWFITARKVRLYGTCAQPSNVRGTDLLDLKESNFQYCEKQ